MKTMKICVAIVIVTTLLSSCATQKIYKGDEAYHALAYADAVDHYTRVDEDKMTAEVKTRLADSYHFMNRPEDAAVWYEKAIKMQDMNEVEYDVIVRYAQTLESTGDYDLAQFYYREAFKQRPEDMAALSRFISSDTNELEDYQGDRFEINALDINKDNRSQMCPVYFKDGVVFTSERDASTKNKTHPWSGRPFVEMYYSDILEDGQFSSPKVFAKNVQTAYDDGVTTFSPDGKTMYFSRTNYIDGDLTTDDQGIVNLKILKSEFKDGKWQDPVELNFNSDDYNCVHPALSEDGKRLYFVSDMPGGMGLSDIYYADVHDDGSVGTPINLGYMINTERSEMFPMLKLENGEDVLYFSSAGHEGYGGMDIMVSYGYGKYWTDPELLPEPINSHKDDFGIAFKNDMKTGYLTSNRDNTEGIDKIYLFKKKTSGTLKTIVSIDEKDNYLSNTEVTLLLDEGSKEKTTNGNGVVFFEINPNEAYELVVQVDGYVRDESYVVPQDQDLYGDTLVRYIHLVKTPDLDSTTIDIVEIKDEDPNVKPIYYEFDEYDITKKASEQLDEVVEIMESNPDLTIKLKSHADSRGTDEYNDWLSSKRAESAKEYLIDSGISANRIDTKAFGEDKLVNDCDEASDDCSEKQHQKNRRTVIILNQQDVSMNK